MPVTARPVVAKTRAAPKAKGKGKARVAKPQPKAKTLTMSDLIAAQGLLTSDSGLQAWDESEVPGLGRDQHSPQDPLQPAHVHEDGARPYDTRLHVGVA